MSRLAPFAYIKEVQLPHRRTTQSKPTTLPCVICFTIEWKSSSVQEVLGYVSPAPFMSVESRYMFPALKSVGRQYRLPLYSMASTKDGCTSAK